MRTWTLALLAVVLIGAGFGINALLADRDAGPAPAPIADAPREPAPTPGHLQARTEPTAPPAAPAAPARPVPPKAVAPTLRGAGTPVSRDEIVTAATKQALDEEARETMRLEALALSKTRRNHAAAALRWQTLLDTARTSEEKVEALKELASALAGSARPLKAAECYRQLLKLPAEQPYQYAVYRLQIGASLYNGKDWRGALDEADRVRGDSSAAGMTRAGASWLRVQCLDALGDKDDARVAARELIDQFESDTSAGFSVQCARRYLEQPE